MSDANFEEQDKADMARLAAGQDAALNELMERHGQRLFHYLLRSVNEDDASDIAQETFVRVYQNRTKFKAAAKFSTWLYTIATNLLRDRFRRIRRCSEVSLDAMEEETGGGVVEKFAPAIPTPSENIISAERAKQIRQAVQSLPEELRTPLILAEYEEQSHAEIAVILNCSAKAVEMRIYHARQQLRKLLEKMFQST